jgi:hypoxanthine phosphoribosyltransferase
VPAQNVVFQDVVLSTEQIQNRVREMSVQISQQLSGELDGRPLHVTAVLDNGFMFMSDLVRHMTVPVICRFLKMESRDLMEDGHERRQILHTPILGIEGSDLLLVDAVLHTGLTLEYLIQQLQRKGVRSVRTAVLIDKPEERRVDLKPDYWAFRVSGRFLVGYGLGHRDLYRNLPYVANIAAP